MGCQAALGALSARWWYIHSTNSYDNVSVYTHTPVPQFAFEVRAGAQYLLGFSPLCFRPVHVPANRLVIV